MTKTVNYQLPQWEATDPVRREDFNEAMESIDAGIKKAADAGPKIAFGEFTVSESATTGTVLTTYDNGVKLAFVWYTNATPIIVQPDEACRMYFDSWNTFRDFVVCGNRIILGASNDSEERELRYVLFY